MNEEEKVLLKLVLFIVWTGCTVVALYGLLGNPKLDIAFAVGMTVLLTSAYYELSQKKE